VDKDIPEARQIADPFGELTRQHLVLAQTQNGLSVIGCSLKAQLGVQVSADVQYNLRR
jgi:hypothetical protein